MPINLQNHRTSNAKLFSSGTTRQKLHTATSFQKTRNGALRVSRNSSGDGSSLMGGWLSRPSSSEKAPRSSSSDSRSRRRHSMGAGLMDNDSAENQALGHNCRQAKRSSLDSNNNNSNRESRTSPSTSRSNNESGSGNTAGTPEKPRRTSSSMNSKKSMRRSASMGTEATRSSLLSKPATTTTTTHNGRRGSDATDPLSSGSENSHTARESLKAKRHQMRRSVSSAGKSNASTPVQLLSPERQATR